MSLFGLDYYYLSGVSLYLITLLVIVLAVDLFIKRRYASKFENVKCAPFLPILGGVHSVLFYGIGGGLYEITKQIKDSFLLWAFYKPIYCVTRPEEMQSILSNQNLLHKGSFYKYVDLMGNTLLVLEVDTWRIHRKLLNKCFNNQQLNNFSPVYTEFAEKLANDIVEEMTIKDFNVIAEKRLITTFYASVGNHPNLGSKEFDEYIKFDLSSAMKSLSTTMMNRYLNPLYHSDFIFFNSPEGKNFERLNKLIEGVVIEVIQEKKKDLENKKEDGNHYFLDTIIGEYDDIENIKNDVKFFGGAAALTLSPAIAACLILLGMHQDEQEKVYNEIVKVMGDETTLGRHHLPHLVYTDMVINESMRLFSPVPLIMRRSVNEIHTGIRKIPKGVDILIPLQNLHRDERYWEDPLKFKPERFLPEEVEKRPPGCFMPFSYGPRNCIGMKYSELVLKFYVVSLLKKFRVFSDCKRIEDIKLTDAMFLSMPSNMKIKFSKRKQDLLDDCVITNN